MAHTGLGRNKGTYVSASPGGKRLVYLMRGSASMSALGTPLETVPTASPKACSSCGRATLVLSVEELTQHAGHRFLHYHASWP